MARLHLEISSRARLTVLGLLMAAVYLLAFTLPYSLFEYGQKPAQTIGSMSNYSFESGFIYLASLAALFAAYWLGYRWFLRPEEPDSRQGRRPALLILGFGLLFNFVLLPVYPFNAVDIYENILRGRIAAVYQLNPFVDTPAQIPADPFYKFSIFRAYPSPYGPLWETLASAASHLAGDNYYANVFLFKVLPIAGYLATAALIGLALNKCAPRRRWSGMYLFAWNPLVILMTGGAGHNDAVMTAFMLLAVYFLIERKFTLATLAAVAGGLVKFIPFIFIPLIALVALRSLSPVGLRAYLLKSVVLGALLFAAAYGPYLDARLQAQTAGVSPGPAAPLHAFKKVFLSYMISNRSKTFTGSAATVVRQLLVPELDGVRGDKPPARTPNTNRLVADLTLGVFALSYAVSAWRIFKRPDPAYAVQEWTRILLVYLLVATVWFQIWYVIWVAALAAVLDDSQLQRLALLFSYLVTWQPFLYNYVTLRPGHWAPLPWRDLLPVLAVTGGVGVYVIVSKLRFELHKSKLR